MKVNKLLYLSIILNPAAVFLTGCEVNIEDSNPGDALPAFSVIDVNSSSARFQEAVSPRDYLGQVSAWYFGHST